MQKNQNYKFKKHYTGVILAAGKSKRLKKNINIKSKNLIEIKNGKSSLDYNIEKLEKFGTSNIFINTFNYHKDFLNKISKRKNKSKIKLINEKKILGTAGGVINICKKNTKYKNIIVLYGDNISKINLKYIIKKHEMYDSSFSIVVYKLKDSKNSGVVTFDKKNIVTSFKEKENVIPIKTNWVNSGIYIIKTDILKKFKIKNCDFGKDLIPLILKKNKVKIYAIKTSCKIFTIDNLRQLYRTKKQLSF